MAKRIETDLQTFIKFWLVPIGIVLLIFFIFKALTGLIIIGASIFLALALKPLVRKVNGFFTRHFGRSKAHQTSSAVFAYLIVVLAIGAIVAIIGPVVVNETAKFVHNFPDTFEKTFGGWNGVNEFGRNFGISDLRNEIMNAINSLSNNLLGFVGNNLISSVSGIADIVMKVVLVLILTLLFLLEGPNIMKSLVSSLAAHGKEQERSMTFHRIIVKMADVVSTYVSRQVFVAMIDGLASGFIVFCLSLFLELSPSLAIPMGMITMLFYLIPMFGQFIGGMLVTVLLFFSSPLAAGIFAVVYILYSQIENNLIAPKIQGNALKLSPLLILCAVTIGIYMFGLLGAIIAIPIAGCIRVLVEEYPNLKALRD